jgi:geranylgeranyl diphosphate synthase type II
VVKPGSAFDLRSYMEMRKELIDRALDRFMPPEDTYPSSVHKAMRYSVFSGGKRFRPILCLAAFDACEGTGEGAVPVACAIELLHTYSLIHDDLPCMDDDDLRRGKPTSHKVFGEAVAVLAGDALLSLAFDVLAREGTRYLGAARTMEVIRDIAQAVGSHGMVGGQVVDMESEGKDVGRDTVEYIHSHKTGALIASSVRSGAAAAGAGTALIARLSEYGRVVGLAFQIVDDVLDEEGRFGDLKSAANLDGKKRKATYPRVVGLEEAKLIATRQIEAAKECVADLGARSLPLLALADLVVSRPS